LDPTLVDRIVKEVLTAMGADAPTATGAPSQPAPAAASSAEQTDSGLPASPGEEAAPAKKAFVTAEELTRRLGASNGNGLELASNEYLTPAAADLIAQRHLTVTRRVAPVQPKANPMPSEWTSLGAQPARPRPPAAGPGPVGLVVEEPRQKIEMVLGALRHDGIRLLPYEVTSCWIENLSSLCGDLCDGKLKLGLAMLSAPAQGVVLANKFKGVWAVQGTEAEAVSAAIEQIGVNVLILDAARATFHQLRHMTRTFITDRMIEGTFAPAVAAIRKLEGA